MTATRSFRTTAVAKVARSHNVSGVDQEDPSDELKASTAAIVVASISTDRARSLLRLRICAAPAVLRVRFATGAIAGPDAATTLTDLWLESV